MLVILSLVFKRHRERPRRKWRIWSVSDIFAPAGTAHARLRRLFDVSKQVLGQLVVHTTNIFIASLVGHVRSSNPCATYFLHVLIDTTLGPHALLANMLAA